MGIGELQGSDISSSFASVYDFIEDTLLPSFKWTAFEETFEVYRQARSSSPTFVRIDILPLLTCVAGGGDAARARPLTAAWVCYILATQILDDVQDQEGESRVWNKEGPEHALSLGLFAIGVAQTALSYLKADSSTQQALGEAFGKVLALSAAWQTRKSRLATLSVDQYFQSLTARTGLIFATGAWAGARIVTSLSEAHVLDALYHFGLYLGIMGQIVDDCRDIKDDLRADRLTLPVIYALSQKKHPQHPQLLEMLSGSSKTTESIERIETLLSEMNAVEWSLQLAEIYRQRAIDALNPLPVMAIEPLLAYVSFNDYSVS